MLFALVASTAEAKIVVVKLSPKIVRVGGTVTLTVRPVKTKTACFVVYEYKPGRFKPPSCGHGCRRHSDLDTEDGTTQPQNRTPPGDRGVRR